VRSWHELIVGGSERVLEGFLAGAEAADGRIEILRGRDLDLERPSIGTLLRGMVSAEQHHLLYAPAPVALKIAGWLSARGDGVGLSLAAHQVVKEASFQFSADVSSREVAARIRRELTAVLPKGVRFEDLDEKEREDPGAKGVELYAPAPEYEYSARGIVRGAFQGVLEMRRRAATLDFVKAGKLALQTSELLPEERG
jgi:hypothetical protein